MKILLATSNMHKIEEIRNKISPLGLNITTPKELGIETEVAETGLTFQDNAQIKADYYYDLTGLNTIADDSGLSVEQLNNDPGVYSSRYAGEDATDDDNMNKLIIELGDERNRAAKFTSVMAYRTKRGIKFFTGYCSGEILKQKKGNEGFGYDPIFYLPQLKKTMAEISLSQKNSLSHRAAALEKLATYLETENENK